MGRLTTYLVKTFARDALGLIVVVTALLWVVQCLRLFDLITVKGQDIATLAGQAALGLPSMLVAFFFAAVGIGLVRGLRALEGRFELQVIHSADQLKAVLRAATLYALGAAVVALALSNIIEPRANQRLNDWSASVAADLVGRTLKPHQFTQVAPGVVVLIGSRGLDGEITDFFADDRRDEKERRTYTASSAVIAADDQSYVLQLNNGSLRYIGENGQLTEVAFGRYDIAFDRLTGDSQNADPLAETDTLMILGAALGSEGWSPHVVAEIVDRMAEALRVFAICAAVVAMAAFPTGKRKRRRLPLEVVVLLLAFAERGLAIYGPLPPLVAPVLGASVILGISLLVIAIRIRPRGRGRRVKERRTPLRTVPA